jgi:hypothetical protein
MTLYVVEVIEMLTVTTNGHIITIKEGKDTIQYDIEKWLVRMDDGEWTPMREPDIHWVLRRYDVKPPPKQ